MGPDRAGDTTLAALARTAESIGATNSKLAKVEALSGYLASLPESHLATATRYFAGRLFATSDPRNLGLGGSALSRVLLEVSGATSEQLSTAWRRHRDAGDVAFELLAGAGHRPDGTVDLQELDEAFGRISAARGAQERIGGGAELLRRCSPPEARYVVKLITGDMRIGLREGLVEAAIGQAFERDKAAVTRADMLLGDLGEVALLAAHDRLAEAAPRLFSPLRSMLASPVADAEEAVRRLGEHVWVEDKYDGIRCQLHCGNNRIALFSRDLRDLTAQFPDVVEAAASLPDGTILDGEILAFRDGLVMPFAALQRRLGRLAPGREILDQVPAAYLAWDILMEGHEPCLDVPLRDRRARLEALAAATGITLAHREDAHGVAGLDRRFDDARARLNEGLMVKDPGSPYTPGRRGLQWLKIKRPLDTLDTVVIGAEWGNGRRRHVLSDLTFAVRVDGSDELVAVGKAYTGLSDAEIAEMTALLLQLSTEERGSYHAVRPEIVIEVAFDVVMVSARHRSGYALRFPRIVKWRRDKGPADIDVLSRVHTLSQARSGARELLVDHPPG